MGLTVADLVSRFDDGGIRLPMMQRDYVWKPRKVVKLLDSLYRGWPIGSFYVWQTSYDHPSRDRVGKAVKNLDGFYGFLLDGQQRLTSISLAIKNDADDNRNARAFFDLENEQFYLGGMRRTILKRAEAGDPLIVPLSEMIESRGNDKSHIQQAIERRIEELLLRKIVNRTNSLKYRERLSKLNKILDGNALCEHFKDEHEEHAFELFSRLNKGGTSLSAGDVEAARLASAATREIVGPMRAVALEPQMSCLGVNFIFLLRCLVTVHRANSSFSKLPRNWAEDTGEIRNSWKRTEAAVRSVVAFVREHIGWTTRRWLPSTMALVPIVYLLASVGPRVTLDKKAQDSLRVHLMISGLRSLFRGAPETTVNGQIAAIRKATERLRGTASQKFDKGLRALLRSVPKNRRYPIRGEDIRNSTSMYSPFMQVYLAYLYNTGAKSWPSGRSLKDIVQRNISDPLAVHHLFPKEHMRNSEIAVERLNCAANYAIISQADNAEIGDQDPFDTWRSLKANQRGFASMQIGFVGREELFREAAYEEFIVVRADFIAKKLNEHLGLN